jgi:N-acyl homoserine lactone hydrolase
MTQPQAWHDAAADAAPAEGVAADGLWKVTPLHVGTLHRKERNFLYASGSEKPLDVPVTMFLLQSGRTNVLVDTGCADPETALDHHRPLDRAQDQHPLAALARHGLEPWQIHVVLTSHLHWDHCYGNAYFPESCFLVQADELAYARAPLPWHEGSYETHESSGPCPPWADTPYKTLDGDTELMPGLTVLRTPGHTPGLQSVLVETREGPFIMPSDTVPTYANWEGRGAHWPHIPATTHYDLSAYYETLQRIEETGARLLPSHDFRVIEEGSHG